MDTNSLSLYKKTPSRETVVILGIPFEDGSSASGLSGAPTYLRENNITNRLTQNGLSILDVGDISLDNNPSLDPLECKKSTIKMAVLVATEVDRHVRSGHKMLAIGGDHSISLGTISGASVALSGDVGIIWIDAHPDVCTWDESITKNIHGMQMAALMGFGDAGLVNAYKEGVKIKTQNILYIGLKDMDDYEIEFLKREQINLVTMFDIERYGLGYVLEKINEFTNRNKNIWVSLDMDSICKDDAPSSPMATDEGFVAREILAISRYIGRMTNVVGMDIVEMSAVGDIDNKTANLAIDLAAKMFGTDAGWYEDYMNNNIHT